MGSGPPSPSSCASVAWQSSVCSPAFLHGSLPPLFSHGSHPRNRRRMRIPPSCRTPWIFSAAVSRLTFGETERPDPERLPFAVLREAPLRQTDSFWVTSLFVPSPIASRVLFRTLMRNRGSGLYGPSATWAFGLSHRWTLADRLWKLPTLM